MIILIKKNNQNLIKINLSIIIKIIVKNLVIIINNLIEKKLREFRVKIININLNKIMIIIIILLMKKKLKRLF